MADADENNRNNDNGNKTNDTADTPAPNMDVNDTKINEKIDNQGIPTTQITQPENPTQRRHQETLEDLTAQPMTTQNMTGLDNTIASLEQVIKEVNQDNTIQRQEQMDIDIDSETDRLLNSSQESIQTGLRNVLDNMNINDEASDDILEEDPTARRSLRIKIRLEPNNQEKEKEKKTEKKIPPPANAASAASDTNEKSKPTKKKKKPKQRQATELEEIAELKKIIKINEELIEEDDTRIKQLEEELDNTLNKLDNTNEENNRLVRANRQLEEEISNQREIIKNMERELQKSNEKINEKLQNQIQELDKITNSQEKTIKDLKEELEDTKSRFTQLEGLLDTMRHRNNLQEKRIDKLKRTLSSDEEKQIPNKRTRQTREATNRELTEDTRKTEQDNTTRYREKQPTATWVPNRQQSSSYEKESSPENSPPRRHRAKANSQSSSSSDIHREARREKQRSPMRNIDIYNENTRQVRPRIGVIMDSNGKYIITELRKHQAKSHAEYITIPEYRTIEDLRRIPRHQVLIEELRTLDQIIIMQGTNNIKRGDEPEDLADRYNQTIIDIARRTNTGIKTIEIPPIDPAKDPRGARKAEEFNKLINKPGKHIKLNRIRGDKIRDTLIEDGIHITEGAAIKISRDIMDQCLNPDNLEPQKKILVPIPPEATSRIIGKRGTTIRRLEEQFRVRIVVDQNIAIIRGEKRKEAAAEIKEEIESAKMRALYD